MKIKLLACRLIDQLTKLVMHLFSDSNPFACSNVLVILLGKYLRASTNLKELENLGCTIVHEVDAHTMSEHPLLKTKFFDRIVFNFPHAGFDYHEHEMCQIE